MTIETNDETGKRGRPAKAAYDVSTALDAEGNAIPLSDDGRLTAVPESWTTSDGMLKREHFVDRKDFWLWKAHRLELQALEKSAEAEEWRDKVENIGKPVAPAARQKRTMQRALKASGLDAASLTPEKALEFLANLLNG